MIRRFSILLMLLFGSCGAEAQTVRFASVAVGTSPAGPEISGAMYRPSGGGPFPGLVLAHSCAGVNQHNEIWAKLLSSWGYVVVSPDSFTPRGETNVCGRGNAVSGNTRVADVAGALAFLNAQPFVRRNELGLVGHSHGGWTTVRAVQQGYDLAAHGLKAAVAYYPSCQAQFDRDVAVPLLILIGDKDDWTPADACRRLQAAGFTRPDLVEAVYYPNAHHAFDNKGLDRTITVANGKSHRLLYDPVAGPDAEARTRAFLTKYLR